jgi:hypothetical protein
MHMTIFGVSGGDELKQMFEQHSIHGIIYAQFIISRYCVRFK